jgi:hypothetical protein
MCADRSPQRRQRATVGWMGPGRGRGRGRVGCCGVSPTANKQDSVAVRMYTDWCCSSEHHRRARAMLYRPFGGFIMLLIILNTWCLAIDSHDQPTFESNWLSAMQPCPADGPLPQARATATIPLWLARRKLQIAHACPKTRHICTGTAHDFAPANPTRRGELGGVGRYARRCAASLRASSTAAGGCVPMACWSTPATEL